MSDRPARDLSGALFRNDKGDNQNRPDYRGDITIGGVTYKLSAWIKEAASGKKYMSLSATAPEGQPAPQRQQQSRPAGGGKPAALDDDVPWSPEAR